MIYGVTVILNDCNFSLKDRSKQVIQRHYYDNFFTNKATAKKEYESQLNRVKHELEINYSNYHLRGRCEFYKAQVEENGRIMNFGTNILSHKIG